MIKKFTFGNPIPTDATVVAMEASTGAIPYMAMSFESDETTTPGIVLTYTMDPDAIVYGLGENVRGINKRGWIYESKCSDDPHHNEGKRSLYAAHNFFVVDGKDRFGVFVDYPSYVTFDIGYSKLDELTVKTVDGHVDLYIIEGESVPAIVKAFRELIGQSYIPPKWAFGLGQSRWSYMNEAEVREVVKSYRDNHIPLDMVYLDIDYMERYKDFTVDTNVFPDLAKLSADLKAEGIRLVPIIDAGVKIESGYDIYEEGVANNYFCKDDSGKDFVAGVWPGRVHFPDVMNKEARDWFGKKYKVLLDQGIEGFWNDMNEPAIFYAEERLHEVFEKLTEYKETEIDIQKYFGFHGLIGSLQNNTEDYKKFYHNMDGVKVRHDQVHNLYGYNMTRAAGEAFDALEPDKRILLFSRSSYIGMHRYGGIWTGDNASWWSHLLMNIKMMPSLNMVGLLYTGADLGGFGGDTTEDLVLRWMAFGIFTPLMRNHAAMGTRRQEAYQFEDKAAFKHIIGIRYGLLPYIYSEYMKAALRNELYFRPMAFDYPEDAFARGVEDQLMLGDGLMVTPVYEQNAKGRYVYLPESMKMIRFRSLSDREETVMAPGHHYITIPLDEVVVFLKPNHILPLATEGGEYVEAVDDTKLTLISFVQGVDPATLSYELYSDNGTTKDYHQAAHLTTLKL